MLEPDKDEKRGENDEENRLPANLQRLKQKLNLWPVPLKSPGSKFKEGGGVILQHNVKYLLYRCCKTWVSMIRSNYRTKKDYKMEEQSWFFTQIYNIYQMDQIWQNACVLWIRQLTWKQDFSRVNNRREVQLDKDAWNTSKFKKIKKKCHFKKIECS